MSGFSPASPSENIVSNPAAGPTILQKLAMQLVLGHLGRHQVGDIRVTLPDKSVVQFGNPGTGPAAEITIHRYRFFTRVAAAADVGFGEAYVEGDYDTKDLTTLLSFFVANQHDVDERNLWSTRLGQTFNRVAHWMSQNTRKGSSKNISFH
jgi:cyclopropane-fatty-acyl-phospholipid synthase